MPKIMILALIIALCSCVTSKLNKYLGKDKDEIIGHYGPPEQTLSDGHTGHIYIYSQREYYSNPYVSNERFKNTYFFIDRHDKVYRWLVKTEPNPPSRIDARVYRY